MFPLGREPVKVEGMSASLTEYQIRATGQESLECTGRFQERVMRLTAELTAARSLLSG